MGNVAHSENDLHNPKGNRNKTPGFTDAERENFAKLVGGIPAEEMPTLLKGTKGKPAPEQNVPGGDATDCDFFDVWRKFHPFKAIAADSKEGDAEGEVCPYTYWSYRFSAKVKNMGWRLDYFVASKQL